VTHAIVESSPPPVIEIGSTKPLTSNLHLQLATFNPKMPEPEGPSCQQPPSKNALKKAAKAAEKALAKAQKAADHELQLRQRSQDAAGVDPAASNYGDRPETEAHDQAFSWAQLSQVAEFEDQTAVFRVVVENARVQSAKLAFLTLAQGLETIQMVVAASEVPAALVSRPMVKFAANIPPESVCTVYAVVKRTEEIVKGTTVQNFELHATKIFVVSRAELSLPLQPADSERPLPLDDKTSAAVAEGENQVAAPLVSLNTRLNNRVLDLRAKINHCIFVVKDGVDALFQEFLRSQGFIRIHTPKITGAPSEGIVFSHL
jgi:aspartyl-tRNA synthetase